MRIRTPDDIKINHAIYFYIVNVIAFSTDEARVFNPFS